MEKQALRWHEGAGRESLRLPSSRRAGSMRKKDRKRSRPMGVAVVTGANRGIGLELVRQLKARGADVVGVCRKRSPELDGLGVRVESDIDITEPAAWARLVARLAHDDIDLLIQNAGVLLADSLDDVDPARVRAQFEVNAVAPLFLTRALARRLREGSKVALITSRMGSIGDNGSGGYYGYRMSKAALNAAGVSLAHDLKPRGIAVVVLHPGSVRTEMTRGQGMIGVEESVRGLLQRIDELRIETTGRFLHQNGDVLPW
jgi:NAD(P)-dependent dehydrogenase (short-subunit alcohol dehydrogenase family)